MGARRKLGSEMKLLLIVGAMSGLLTAQTPVVRPRTAPPPPSAGPNLAVAVQAAEAGHCDPALGQISRSYSALREPGMRKRAGIAGLHCAIAKGDTASALFFLGQLHQSFSRDPDVLLASVHALSGLSDQVADELHRTAPNSWQTAELTGEGLEFQGKTDEAIAAYRRVLQINPSEADIHYRIGRLLLTRQHTPEIVAQARREMEAELRTHPDHAGAEFVLGDLAREGKQWPQAVQHFQRATQISPDFGDAFVGLGIALLSEGDLSAALPALQTAERLEPDNPEVHRQLAVAYGRLNRAADAQRETALAQQQSSQENAAPSR